MRKESVSCCNKNVPLKWVSGLFLRGTNDFKSQDQNWLSLTENPVKQSMDTHETPNKFVNMTNQILLQFC